MRSQGAVAVVVPCRNMAKFLPKALATVRQQGDLIDEVIIVDDGSQDDPEAAVSEYRDLVRMLPGPGKGSAIARNIGILAARSEFIAFLDADDFWLPGKLDAQVARLRSSRLDFCFTDWAHCENEDDPLDSALAEYSCVTEGDAFGALLQENFVLTSSVVVRRDVFARSGLFKQGLRGGQDFELWLRIAQCAEFAYVPQVLAAKRRHGGNITLSYDYPVLHTYVWDEIRATHRDAPLEKARYIARRHAEALHQAGRHLLRNGDVTRAEVFLRRALKADGFVASRLFWAAISMLPEPFVQEMLRVNRSLGASAKPGA